MKTINLKSGMIFLLFVFSLVLFPAGNVKAAVLKIRYHDTTYSYSGTKAGVTIDGKTADLGDCPGLIMDDTILLPLEEIFQDELGAETSYDSESGEITLSKFGNTMVMYLDSTIAYVNGEQTELDTVPLSVKYVAASETRIMIPARSAAEALGFTYTWNSSKKRSEITMPFNIYYDGAWTHYTSTQGTVTVNGSKVSLGKMPAIKIGGSMLVPAKKVFADSDLGTSYQYKEYQDGEEIKKEAIISGNNKTLTFTMGNKTALLDGTEVKAPVTPRAVINGYNNVEYIMVPVKFIAEQLGYSYTWNTKTKTAELYTTESDLLEDKEMYFISQNSSEYSSYVDAVASSQTSYTLAGEGTGSRISGVFYQENALENGERFVISAEQPFGEIQVSYDEAAGQISAVCKGMASEDTAYPFENAVIPQAVSTYNGSTEETTVVFSVSDSAISYQASLSEDQANLYIDVYKNCLTSVSASQYGTQDLLVLTGAAELSYSYTAENNVLQITFPYTECLTETEFASDQSPFLKKVSIEQKDQDLCVTVQYQGMFYLQITGSSFQVIFYDADDETAKPDSAGYDIYIPLPDDVNYKKLTDKDPYADKKFQVLVPGDQTNYYRKNPIISGNDVVEKIKISLNSSGKTVITVKTSKIRGYRLNNAGNAAGIRLGSLKKMYSQIVLLDAGHGGKDSGAVNGKYMEKDFNLSILYKKAKQYFNQSETIKAFWTRADDTFINLYERPKLSKKAKADIFISLHMNSADSSAAKGLEVYYSKINDSKGSSGLTSKKMAEFFQDSLISKIGCYDRGFKSAEYVVCKYNTVPSILIELGFITNSQDLSRMKSSKLQDEAAKAIYDTIEELFEKYPTGR